MQNAFIICQLVLQVNQLLHASLISGVAKVKRAEDRATVLFDLFAESRSRRIELWRFLSIGRVMSIQQGVKICP